jgi:hypothetical protein
MTLKGAQAKVSLPASHARQLAQRVLAGAPDASQAAIILLESCEPETIDAAVALLADQGTVTMDAFDRVADAWETYRHLRNLSWD